MSSNKWGWQDQGDFGNYLVSEAQIVSKQKMKCQEDYRNQFLAEIKWFAYKALSLLLWLLESPDDISVALLCQLEHPVLIPLLCILIISSSVTESVQSSVTKRLQCRYKKVLSSIQNMMECPHSKDLFLITFLLKIVALKMFIWFNFLCLIAATEIYLIKVCFLLTLPLLVY